jgi:hypothetical protein
MPLSSNPEKREAQLANLVPGGAPAPAGNQRAVTHRGYAAIARDRLDGKVAEVFEAIGEDLPLQGPDGEPPAADVAQVRLLAECMCRLEDVAANIRDFGLFDQKSGDIRPAVDLERRLRKEAAGHLDALGLNPRSRVKLGLDVAKAAGRIDAASALSRARRETDPAKRKAILEEAGIPTHDDGTGDDD